MDPRGKGGRRFLPALAGCLAFFFAAGSAGSAVNDLWVFGDAERAGSITLLIYGPAGADALVYEQIDDQLYPLRAVALDQDGVGAGWDITRWRCGRRERRFVVRVEREGEDLAAAYETRTPSCRERLALELPRTARRGGTLRATIRDRWRIGAVRPRLCVVRPGVRARCRTVSLRGGSRQRNTTLRLARQKGPQRVQLRLYGYHRTVTFRPAGRLRLARGGAGGPRVLLTGDSMMLNIDNLLADRLRGKVRIASRERVGRGISKPGYNWVTKARGLTRRLRQQATVVFLGANDASPMRTPSGQVVDCCEAWIEEYTRRVAAMMRAYRQGGDGTVIWLTLPAPRAWELAIPFAAVNAAIRRAAERTPGVKVLALDELFTPGFRWRADMPVRGRIRRVRADDGIHLSILGARIAAARVASELRARGVL